MRVAMAWGVWEDPGLHRPNRQAAFGARWGVGR